MGILIGDISAPTDIRLFKGDVFNKSPTIGTPIQQPLMIHIYVRLPKGTTHQHPYAMPMY